MQRDDMQSNRRSRLHVPAAIDAKPLRLNNVAYRTLPLRRDDPPSLYVVVDTEAEFEWGREFDRSATSVSAMSRQKLAQKIFDQYGLRPMYLIDYAVASQADGYEPLRDILNRHACVVGAHLHPWINPPLEEDISDLNSFAGNLPAELEERKLRTLVAQIEKSFAITPLFFKAGRYGAHAADAARRGAVQAVAAFAFARHSVAVAAGEHGDADAGGRDGGGADRTDQVDAEKRAPYLRAALPQPVAWHAYAVRQKPGATRKLPGQHLRGVPVLLLGTRRPPRQPRGLGAPDHAQPGLAVAVTPSNRVAVVHLSRRVSGLDRRERFLHPVGMLGALGHDPGTAGQ